MLLQIHVSSIRQDANMDIRRFHIRHYGYHCSGQRRRRAVGQPRVGAH